MSTEATDPGWLKFRKARVWSNAELRQFSPLFRGSVVNVSGGRDEDKEGDHYANYFRNCEDYYITNFETYAPHPFIPDTHRIFLDLEAPLPADLRGRFDVAFNHTTLEHVYECRRAFSSICEMSRDVVIVVVPYIQQMHAVGYGDFWRFTPQTMKRLYEENGLQLRYCSANGADRGSIYLFSIGYRNQSWDEFIPARFDMKLVEDKPLYGNDYSNVIGANVIS